MARPRKYKTEEERKAAKKESLKRWRETNPEKVKEQRKRYYQENAEKEKEMAKRWYQENPEKERERKKQYYNTPMGRAVHLVNAYQQADKNANRGECTLTAQWIVDNIFSKPCHYCGETDWTKLGCDRIDNSLPHTPDNVVPCCDECNKKRNRKTYEEFLMTIPSGSGRQIPQMV